MSTKLPTKLKSKRKKTTSSRRGEIPARKMDSYYLPTECEARIQNFPSSKFTIQRYVNLDTLRAKGFSFPELLEVQGVKKFLNLSGTYYPDLVKEFYANLAYDDENKNHCSYVQGEYIDLLPEVFSQIAGLQSTGTYPCESANPGWEGFNQVIFYQSCLRHPSLYIDGQKPKAGDMTVEDRLILYIVTYCLSPKTSPTHATPTQLDLAFVYAIKNRLVINWPMEIIRQMNERAKSLKPQQIAYPVLISRILEHYNVDVSNFEAVTLRSADELNDNVLHAMQIYQNEETNVWEWRDKKVFGEGQPQQHQEPAMDEDIPQGSQSQEHSNNLKLDELEGIIQSNHNELSNRLNSIQAQHESFVTHVDQKFASLETSLDAKFGSLSYLIKTMLDMQFGGPSHPPPPPSSS